MRCNVFLKGNMPSYTVFLERMYGAGIVQTLIDESRKSFPVKAYWLQEQIDHFKDIIK